MTERDIAGEKKRYGREETIHTMGTCDKVLSSLDVVDGGQLEEDGWQAHQTVGGDVHELKRRADGHLGGQARDSVTRQVQLYNR